MCAAHDLPNSHKNLRNVLPVAVDIVVVLSAGASASDVASRPQAGRLSKRVVLISIPDGMRLLRPKFELLEPVSQHLGDESWLRHVGDVAMACQDVDTRTWDCRGGHGCDLCKLGRGLGSG